MIDTGIPSIMMFPSCGPDPPTKKMSAPEQTKNNAWLVLSLQLYFGVVTRSLLNRQIEFSPEQKAGFEMRMRRVSLTKSCILIKKATNFKVWQDCSRSCYQLQFTWSRLLSIMSLNPACDSLSRTFIVTIWCDDWDMLWYFTAIVCYWELRTFWLLFNNSCCIHVLS